MKVFLKIIFSFLIVSLFLKPMSCMEGHDIQEIKPSDLKDIREWECPVCLQGFKEIWKDSFTGGVLCKNEHLVCRECAESILNTDHTEEGGSPANIKYACPICREDIYKKDLDKRRIENYSKLHIDKDGKISLEYDFQNKKNSVITFYSNLISNLMRNFNKNCDFRTNYLGHAQINIFFLESIQLKYPEISLDKIESVRKILENIVKLQLDKKDFFTEDDKFELLHLCEEATKNTTKDAVLSFFDSTINGWFKAFNEKDSRLFDEIGLSEMQKNFFDVLKPYLIKIVELETLPIEEEIKIVINQIGDPRGDEIKESVIDLLQEKLKKIREEEEFFARLEIEELEHASIGEIIQKKEKIKRAIEEKRKDLLKAKEDAKERLNSVNLHMEKMKNDFVKLVKTLTDYEDVNYNLGGIAKKAFDSFIAIQTFSLWLMQTEEKFNCETLPQTIFAFNSLSIDMRIKLLIDLKDLFGKEKWENIFKDKVNDVSKVIDLSEILKKTDELNDKYKNFKNNFEKMEKLSLKEKYELILSSFKEEIPWPFKGDKYGTYFFGTTPSARWQKTAYYALRNKLEYLDSPMGILEQKKHDIEQSLGSLQRSIEEREKQIWKLKEVLGIAS